MKIKNIPKNLSIYSKRAILWHSNSEPYLSGDLFADHSDVNIYPYMFRGTQPSRKRVREASVIFCRSEFLEKFLDEYQGNINAKVLILGNSDRDFESFEFKIPNSVKQIFAQNLLFRDSRFSLLPIGLENRRLGVNGARSRFNVSYQSKQKLDQVLMGPLSETHVERKALPKLFANVQGVTYMRDRIPPDQYIDIVKKHKFVAAPRGNGMDTHRFWETLYLDSIPIVLKGIWSDQVSELGIPLVAIDQWEPRSIKNIFESALFLQSAPRLSEALWWNFWKHKINSYC